MRRTIIILFVVMAAGGCAPVADYRPVATTCHLHGLPLSDAVVPIAYGLPAPDEFARMKQCAQCIELSSAAKSARLRP